MKQGRIFTSQQAQKQPADELRGAVTTPGGIGAPVAGTGRVQDTDSSRGKKKKSGTTQGLAETEEVCKNSYCDVLFLFLIAKQRDAKTPTCLTQTVPEQVHGHLLDGYFLMCLRHAAVNPASEGEETLAWPNPRKQQDVEVCMTDYREGSEDDLWGGGS